MSKRQIIMLLGALLIAITLFSGFPAVWDTIAYIAIGILLIIVAYTIQPHRSPEKGGQAPFVDAQSAPHTPSEM